MNNCTVCSGNIDQGVFLKCGHSAHPDCKTALKAHNEPCPKCVSVAQILKDPVTITISKDGFKTFMQVERDSKLIDVLERIQKALNFAAPEDVKLVYRNPRMANPQIVSPFRNLKDYVEGRKEVALTAEKMTFSSDRNTLSSLSSIYQLPTLYGLTNSDDVAALYKEKVHSSLV